MITNDHRDPGLPLEKTNPPISLYVSPGEVFWTLVVVAAFIAVLVSL